MSALTDTATLADGRPIPAIGFGTWLLQQRIHQHGSVPARVGTRLGQVSGGAGESRAHCWSDPARP
ncbi:hypothetical protein [Dactylosporangium sp. NPDC000521]|uniref:hypothetical protein n=1 Tax=Dactylosporangium sp. NPDC000521 TaxID=3363975 RepID=UPI0036AD112B